MLEINETDVFLAGIRIPLLAEADDLPIVSLSVWPLSEALHAGTLVREELYPCQLD
jgi:hypothetical protein